MRNKPNEERAAVAEPREQIARVVGRLRGATPAGRVCRQGCALLLARPLRACMGGFPSGEKEGGGFCLTQTQ